MSTWQVPLLTTFCFADLQLAAAYEADVAFGCELYGACDGHRIRFTQLRSYLHVCVCVCACVSACVCVRVCVCVLAESAISAAVHRLPARCQMLAEAVYLLIHLCVRPPLG